VVVSLYIGFVQSAVLRNKQTNKQTNKVKNLK